jgi:hypothetical protein
MFNTARWLGCLPNSAFVEPNLIHKRSTSTTATMLSGQTHELPNRLARQEALDHK